MLIKELKSEEQLFDFLTKITCVIAYTIPSLWYCRNRLKFHNLQNIRV
jgi:hypothetical protein